ncbi:MAG: acyl carrier protein [Legionella sp.]
MKRERVVEKTQEIFRDIFNDHELVIHDGFSAHDRGDWDSLNHINLIGTIQREFNIKFELSELQQLKNVGAMIDLILKKINP